jgi:hypothetical protein
MNEKLNGRRVVELRSEAGSFDVRQEAFVANAVDVAAALVAAEAPIVTIDGATSTLVRDGDLIRVNNVVLRLIIGEHLSCRRWSIVARLTRPVAKSRISPSSFPMVSSASC